MKPGDLVKMKRGYSAPGIVLSMPKADGVDFRSGALRWVRILWPDYGAGAEKVRDLEVINDTAR